MGKYFFRSACAMIIFYIWPSIGNSQTLDSLYHGLVYHDGIARKTICVKPLDLQKAALINKNCVNVVQSTSRLAFAYNDIEFNFNIDPVCEDGQIDNIFLLIDSHQECLITVCFYESCECQLYKGNYYPIGIITSIEPLNHSVNIEQEGDSSHNDNIMKWNQ